VTRVPVVTDDSRTFWTLVRDTLERLERGASKHCLEYGGFPADAGMVTQITDATQITHHRLGVRFDWIRA
jgi:hypothetical protein